MPDEKKRPSMTGVFTEALEELLLRGFGWLGRGFGCVNSFTRSVFGVFGGFNSFASSVFGGTGGVFRGVGCSGTSGGSTGGNSSTGGGGSSTSGVFSGTSSVFGSIYCGSSRSGWSRCRSSGFRGFSFWGFLLAASGQTNRHNSGEENRLVHFNIPWKKILIKNF
jgi:hypothetical protein